MGDEGDDTDKFMVVSSSTNIVKCAALWGCGNARGWGDECSLLAVEQCVATTTSDNLIASTVP